MKMDVNRGPETLKTCCLWLPAPFLCCGMVDKENIRASQFAHTEPPDLAVPVPSQQPRIFYRGLAIPALTRNDLLLFATTHSSYVGIKIIFHRLQQHFFSG
jgi:hypothetical protein